MNCSDKLPMMIMLITLAIVIAGCGDYSNVGGGGVLERHITLQDGRDITCVTMYGNGIDCDWRAEA